MKKVQFKEVTLFASMLKSIFLEIFLHQRGSDHLSQYIEEKINKKCMSILDPNEPKMMHYFPFLAHCTAVVQHRFLYYVPCSGRQLLVILCCHFELSHQCLTWEGGLELSSVVQGSFWGFGPLTIFEDASKNVPDTAALLCNYYIVCTCSPF